MQKPFYQLEHHHEVIRQFTPNWFTMTMGTGVVALILPEFSFVHEWFWSVGAGLWQFNTIDLLRKLMSIHPIDPRGDQIHP